MKKFESSLLQFVPKGSFYNEQDEQLKSIEKVWDDFFNYDRDIFALSMLLDGTAYSKGRMIEKLLSNPIKKDKAIVSDSSYSSYEKEIIKYNLKNESMARSIKNLLMLKRVKINNSRTRNIVLGFIFNRDIKELEGLAISFKKKLADLVRHVLGKQNLYKVFNGGDEVIKNSNYIEVIHFLFNKKYEYKLNKFNLYNDLREAAKEKDVGRFLELAKKKMLPRTTLLGFRNTYKLDVDLKDIFETGKMSKKEKIQQVSAAKKSGADIKVDYFKQELYDLWKLFYVKLMEKDVDEMTKLSEAIENKSVKKLDIELGSTVVIFDVSKSMEGSDKRKWHPFLTGVSLISVLNNIKKVLFSGGVLVNTGCEKIPKTVIPSGATKLWKLLYDASLLEPETVLVISDGYENSIKGSFEHVYKELRKRGCDFNLIHINPVYASEVNSVRRLVSDVKPMMIENYKFLKTNLLFEMIMKNKKLAKKMLLKYYQLKIGEKKK